MQRLVPPAVGGAMILVPATLRAGEQTLVDSRSGSRVFQFFALRRRRERGGRAIGASNFAGKEIDLTATYELKEQQAPKGLPPFVRRGLPPRYGRRFRRRPPLSHDNLCLLNETYENKDDRGSCRFIRLAHKRRQSCR
jgi:hypothetical protein